MTQKKAWTKHRRPIRGRALTHGRKRRPLEHHEQVRVCAHLDAFHPAVLYAAVPNGGKRTKSEAVRLKKEGVRSGYPDLLIDEARGPYHGLRVEMKRVHGDRPRQNQRAIHRRLAERGYRVVVGYGSVDAIAQIEAYLALPRTDLPTA